MTCMVAAVSVVCAPVRSVVTYFFFWQQTMHMLTLGMDTSVIDGCISIPVFHGAATLFDWFDGFVVPSHFFKIIE